MNLAALQAWVNAAVFSNTTGEVSPEALNALLQGILNAVILNDGSGFLQSANFPALTGDVTTAAGSLATSLSPGVVTAAKLAAGAAATNLGFTPLNPNNNLSDLANRATARANLGAAVAYGLATLDASGELTASQTPRSLTSPGPVTPEMYGAVGDGVADDTTPVQNALMSGRAVYLPNKYRLTSATSLTPSGGLRVYGDGQKSQLKLSGAATNLQITIDYSGDYASQNNQVVLRDFAVVETTANASHAMVSILGAGSSSFVGMAADTLVMDNVSFLGDGTGYAPHALLLQDVRLIRVSISAHGCVGGTAGAGGAAGSAAIYFASSVQSGGNAPGLLHFHRCLLIGGDCGIMFVASGATAGAQDPQGVWITDCGIVGQQTASVSLSASDPDNAEWHVRGCSLSSAGDGIDASGVGRIHFTDNVIVQSSNSGAGIRVNNGIAIWTLGEIRSNTITGGGGSCVPITGTWNLASGATDGFLFIDGNMSMNTSATYSVTGTAVKFGTNY